VTWLAKQMGLWHGKAKGAAAGTKEASAAAAAGKQTSDLYGEALKNLTGAAGGASPRLASLTEKLKAQRTAFAETKAATAEQVQSYKGLISQSRITAGQVVKDLRNQVSNFRTYSKDVHRLIAAGVNPAAIQELSKKGPEYVHALATGSNRELNAYKRYWRDRQTEVKGAFARSMQAQYQDLVRKMRAMQREINKLRGKNITVSATAEVTPTQKTLAYLRASGSPLSLARTRRGATKGWKIPGYGGGDIVPIMAEPGEAVVPKEAVREPAFKAWAKAHRIPGFQRGGIIAPSQLTPWRNQVVGATERFGERFADRLASTMSKALTKKLEAAVATGMLGGLSGRGGYRWQMAVLRQAFPGLQLISGFRPGARTHATGALSYHARGRAVDVPPRMDVFNWIRANYGARTRELIFSPAGTRQVWNGRPHLYHGVTRDDHWNHVHWAYRTGAWKVLADRIAKVHKGEMIVPAKPAEMIRRNVDRGGLGGAGVDELVAKLATAMAAHPPVVELDGQRMTNYVRQALRGLGYRDGRPGRV
jgi:hypothetical protein